MRQAASGSSPAGGRRWSLISTGPANGETAGQLLFFAGGAGGTKVTFRDTGNVGIGTATPGERLEVFGADATLRLRNQNDAIGASGSTLAFKMLGNSAVTTITSTTFTNVATTTIDVPAGSTATLLVHHKEAHYFQT
mgnify:CR=1 FL=1